jgi:LSD1 subclass zinc finger protein
MATSDAPRGPEAPVAVLKCSGCGAPLASAKPGVAVECPSCGTDNDAKTGGEALVAEQADRARAEQLLASLGQPPSRLQRAAAATVHPSILVVFSPAILFVLFKVAAAVEWAVDAWRHERVAELDPTMAVLLSGGAFASVFLLFLLPWSLLGLRSDARRTLQAALACKPPTLDGGPSRCRECGADLTVPKGAYGVRCTYCSADNLLLLPRDWVESARNVQAGLRLGASEARRASKEAKEAIRRGMAWRAPVLLGLIAFLTIRSVATARSKGAVWEDYLINEHVDGYGVRVGATAERPRSLPRCDYGIGMWKLYTRSTLTLGPEGDCGTDKVLCGELVPLRRGDTLRVLWQSEPRAGQIRIGPAPVRAAARLVEGRPLRPGGERGRASLSPLGAGQRRLGNASTVLVSRVGMFGHWGCFVGRRAL